MIEEGTQCRYGLISICNTSKFWDKYDKTSSFVYHLLQLQCVYYNAKYLKYNTEQFIGNVELKG